MGRLVSKDTELEGWFLPEGTAINAVMASVQENNENYEDAKQFKPERWLNNNSNNGAFLAFGGGSRVCVGNNFSILEQKVFLTLLLQKMKWEFKNKNDIVEHSDQFLRTPKKKTIVFTSL